MNKLQEELQKYNYLELDLVLDKLNKNRVVCIKYVYSKKDPKINVMVLYKYSWNEIHHYLRAWRNELQQIFSKKQSLKKTLTQIISNSLWRREIFFWVWSVESSESILKELSLENALLPEEIPNSLISVRLSKDAYELLPGLWCEHVEPTSIVINNKNDPYVTGQRWQGDSLNDVIADWCEQALSKKIKVINI